MIETPGTAVREDPRWELRRLEHEAEKALCAQMRELGPTLRAMIAADGRPLHIVSPTHQLARFYARQFGFGPHERRVWRPVASGDSLRGLSHPRVFRAPRPDWGLARSRLLDELRMHLAVIEGKDRRGIEWVLS